MGEISVASVQCAWKWRSSRSAAGGASKMLNKFKLIGPEMLMLVCRPRASLIIIKSVNFSFNMFYGDSFVHNRQQLPLICGCWRPKRSHFSSPARPSVWRTFCWCFPLKKKKKTNGRYDLARATTTESGSAMHKYRRWMQSGDNRGGGGKLSVCIRLVRVYVIQ